MANNAKPRVRAVMAAYTVLLALGKPRIFLAGSLARSRDMEGAILTLMAFVRAHPTLLSAVRCAGTQGVRYASG